VQEGSIEIAGLLEAWPIEDFEYGILPSDEFLTAERLQRAIHMNRLQSGGIGKFSLGDWKLACELVGQADSAEPDNHLTEQM
jgi:hypothetical protein